MKFISLFEESKSKKIPKYSQTIINHVRGLIEKSFNDSNDSEIPGSIMSPVPSDGLNDEKELLFDNDSLDNDTNDSETVNNEEIDLEKSENDNSLDNEDLENPKGPDFLDDEAFNNLKKVQSEKLKQTFEPEESEESSEEIAERLAKNISLNNEDYFLSDDNEVKNVNEVKKSSKTVNESKPKKVNEDDVDDLKKEVKNVNVTDENPEALKIYNELIDLIQAKDYDETVDFVDDIVKDPKLKFLLSLGFGGEFANLKLKLKKTSIPAKRLVPTQNEIGTEETLKYLVQGKDIDVCFEKSTIIKKPIVTFQGTFIVDGHHRWSQIFVTNPDANVVCIDITGNLSPLSMLKAVQCTIGSNTGKLIRKNIQGQNLYDVSEKDILKYLKENLSDSVRENLEMYYENPVEELTKNVIQMQRNNTPILNAPDRGEMPQTSKDPELFDDLKNGVTDV